MADDTMNPMAWCDLTVENAVELKDFYQGVMGWSPQGVDMGGYEDFSMVSPFNGKDVAGICHEKGPNADMPAQWILYFMVEDLDASLAQVKAKGGEQITAIKTFGDSRYTVIKDPAGAVCAIFQQ